MKGRSVSRSCSKQALKNPGLSNHRLFFSFRGDRHLKLWANLSVQILEEFRQQEKSGAKIPMPLYTMMNTYILWRHLPGVWTVFDILWIANVFQRTEAYIIQPTCQIEFRWVDLLKLVLGTSGSKMAVLTVDEGSSRSIFFKWVLGWRVRMASSTIRP